jgi:hypothetical protein
MSDAINAATEAVAAAMEAFGTQYWSLVVPGMRNVVDPYSFAMIVSSIMSNESDPTARVLMREYSFAEWVDLVDEDIDRRKITPPPEQTTQPSIEKPAPPTTRSGVVVGGPFHTTVGGPPMGGPPIPTAGIGAGMVTPGGVASTPPIPAPPSWLFTREREAWIQARVRGAEYVRGLGNFLHEKTQQLVVESWAGESVVSEADQSLRLRARELVRVEAADALAHGRSARELARTLRNATKDWARDWERIANTELQGAYNEGQVITAVRNEGLDAKIARIPESDACVHCQRLFLDVDGRPKLFTAEGLAANGTNVGRKALNWLPTIWPVHPNCRCDVQHVPEGLDFDDQWLLKAEAKAGRSVSAGQTPDGLEALGVGVL